MLGDLLRATAAREPETVAFVDGARRMTYSEWDWLSDRAAFALAQAGVRAGDVVALLLQPSLAYPIAYLGAAKIGAITAGINPRLGPREIDEVLDHSRARVLVSDDPGRSGHGVLAPEALNRPGGEPPRAHVDAEEPVAIVFTSGTTGTPKGAVFTARALEAVRRIEAARGSAAHARGVQNTPMPHMGFMTKIASFIARASTAVLVERWSARDTLELIERERLTHIGGVPTQLALMLRDPTFAARDLSSVRSVLIGGAPATPALVRAVRDGFRAPVEVRYSTTELATCTATRGDDDDETIASTVGRTQPEVDLAVADPNGDGIGEICARSPAMFSGYWRGPRALDAHGYFRTGDLGRLDASGNLILCGRAKEMYIRGGYNVYPLEVENALALHPDVARAAVVPVPDDVLGERGRAYVVARDPAHPPDAADLKAFITEHIADYKIPDEFVFRDDLPMTPMFKVDKRALTAGTTP